jgi:hypothetical protein
MPQQARYLERELALAQTANLRALAGPALRELIDDGLRVFERCSVSATGADENLGVLFPFLHLVEMLDSVEVQLENSVVGPAFVTLRSAFESYLTVLYVCEHDTPRRGAAWMVTEIHRRIRALDRWDPETQLGKQFRAALRADHAGKEIALPTVSNLASDRSAYVALLDASHLRAAAEEFVRVRTASKRIPKFHALWGGPGDIEQLARHLGKAGQYEVLYRYWSAIAHGELLGRQLGDVNDEPAVTALRNATEMKNVYSHAFSFGFDAANAILKYYRVEEVDGRTRRDWYKNRIRPAYLAVGQQSA